MDYGDAVLLLLLSMIAWRIRDLHRRVPPRLRFRAHLVAPDGTFLALALAAGVCAWKDLGPPPPDAGVWPHLGPFLAPGWGAFCIGSVIAWAAGRWRRAPA